MIGTLYGPGKMKLYYRSGAIITGHDAMGIVAGSSEGIICHSLRP